MRLKVMYFASARDAAGTKQEQLQFDQAPTVRALAQRVNRLHPGLRALEMSTRYAVNQEIVDGNELLADGDEVGVLPAVTGG